MFESLGNAIREQQEKFAKKQQWIKQFVALLDNREILIDPFKEAALVHTVRPTISKLTKVGGVDGGIVSEEMTGFDLALYRAVATVFWGIGDKVESTYIPHFDPDPNIFFSPSLQSRQEFNRICTLRRLYVEYEVALMTIKQAKPTVLFIDGKVAPLSSDFVGSSSGKMVSQAEKEVKQIYTELVHEAMKQQVLLCGVVKDSRSRELTRALGKIIPDLIKSENLDRQFMQKWPFMLTDLQDTFLADSLLQQGERTAWCQTPLPSWLELEEDTEIRMTLAKPVEEDQPVKLECIINPHDQTMIDACEIGLSALQILSNHGLPLALPTVILEADERTKLNADHLDAVIDQISMTLGIPREQLRKRRYFTSSLRRL